MVTSQPTPAAKGRQKVASNVRGRLNWRHFLNFERWCVDSYIFKPRFPKIGVPKWKIQFWNGWLGVTVFWDTSKLWFGKDPDTERIDTLGRKAWTQTTHRVRNWTCSRCDFMNSYELINLEKRGIYSVFDSLTRTTCTWLSCVLDSDCVLSGFVHVGGSAKRSHLFGKCYFTSVLWPLNSRAISFSLFSSVDWVPFQLESPLPVFSEVKAPCFSCFGGCQKRTIVSQHAILPPLFDVWSRANFFVLLHLSLSSFPAATKRLMTWECVNLHCQALIKFQSGVTWSWVQGYDFSYEPRHCQ